MKKLFLIFLLAVAPLAQAQTSFRIFPDTSGTYSSAVILAPTYVNARALAASVAESFTVPAGVRFVIFSANCDFYANPTATATVPSDTTDGSASMLNPSAWMIGGVTTISVISAGTCIITAAFYT